MSERSEPGDEPHRGRRRRLRRCAAAGPGPRQHPPASGAWRPSDPPGHRQFLRTFVDRTPSCSRAAASSSDVTPRLRDVGHPRPRRRSNAVLVCHALTGDSHAAGPARAPVTPTPGWWDGLIGPGRLLDTERWFVVCVNVLGGCQGSTGPASARPDRLGRYGSEFPVVTIRDMVRTQARLADASASPAGAAVIGGSMGGMQVLEWAVMFPDRVRRPGRPSPSPRRATAQQIALRGAPGRRAIALDLAGETATTTTPPRATAPTRGLAPGSPDQPGHVPQRPTCSPTSSGATSPSSR